MTRLRELTGVIVCGSLFWAGPAGANAVTDWNAIAVQAVGVGRAGPPGLLDLALVQAAVHDAVQAIEGRFRPYHVKVPGASGSPEAAVAAAAYHVLAGLYPAQAASLGTTYSNYLAGHFLVGDEGLAVGQAAAAGMLPLYRPAPSPLPPPFTGGTDPGDWRPTDSLLQGSGPGNGLPGPPFGPPPPFAAGANPWLGTIAPLTLNRADQFRMGPPLRLASGKYRREYEEVRQLGARLGSTRTAEQTDLGYFYADNFLALWYRTLRGIADQHVPDLSDSARLFALATLAAADAGITAWDSKYHYSFWRPITAIREGDDDGNRRTIGDPFWEPLLNTPNYPDHTSGANNLTGAITRTLRLFFRTDRLDFEVSSAFPLAVVKVRQYERFSDMAQDVVDVRIYQGIHFRNPDEVGRKQGEAVAKWVFGRFLRPVRHDDGCDRDHDHDDDDDDDHGMAVKDELK